MPEENKKGFSGIFNSLRKIIFIDPPQEPTPPSNPETPVPSTTNPSAPVFQPRPPVAPVVPDAAQEAITLKSTDDMVNKIYGLLETINKPGIDFFEFWNASSAMGGVDATNLRNAYKALNVLGLTREKILSSGAEYKQELNQRLSEEIRRKLDEKNALENKLHTERRQLEQQRKDLEVKTSELNASIKDTEQRLSKLDEQYRPQLQAINLRVETGQQALGKVLTEMQAVLDTVATAINN